MLRLQFFGTPVVTLGGQPLHALTRSPLLRDLLATDDVLTLDQLITEAAAQRAQWAGERARGEWEKQEQPALNVPTFGESLGRMLVGGLFRREKKA